MTRPFRFLVAFSLLLFPVPLHAAPYGETAMLVLEVDAEKLDAALILAIDSPSADVRVAAARVAAVRDRQALLEKIEARLATESDINVARELVRSAILLGGRDLVTPALATSARFDNRLDGPIAVAVARLGAGEAIPLYFSTLQKLESTPRTNFFRVALWGTPVLVTSTAARILGTGDPAAWKALIGALDESSMHLEAGVLRVALGHPDEEIRESTINLSVTSLTDPQQQVDAKAKDVLAERLEIEATEPARISFRRELARRLVGGKAGTRADWLEWIATNEGSEFLRRSEPLLEVLSSEEVSAMLPDAKKSSGRRIRGTPVPIKPVTAAPFFAPSVLPSGMTTAVLAETGCRQQWVGLGEVSVDRQGRVQTLAIDEVATDARCRRALEAITRLSLTYNRSITSPMATNNAVFIKPRGGDLCLDEGPVPTSQEFDFEACIPYRFSDDTMACKAPVVRKRTEPDFPLSARRSMPAGFSSTIIIEALVTETGCVREAHLVGQSPYGELNREALLALMQWKFDPGETNGVAIPVVFNLSINFSRR